MENSIYNKVKGFLDNYINHQAFNDAEAIEIIKAHQAQELTRKKIYDTTVNVIESKKNKFIEDMGRTAYTVMDTFTITKFQQKLDQSIYLKKINDVQLKKIEILLNYYSGNKQESHSKIMLELLKEEAKLRKKMLLNDIKMKTVISKLNYRIEGKETLTVKESFLLTKTQEELLEINVDEYLNQLSKKLLLSPNILYCYSLDLALVLKTELNLPNPSKKNTTK